ncbi:MAG: hypothetical protein NTY09_10485 [bacterium]|nr:hypothetical protein [bacterium]
MLDSGTCKKNLLRLCNYFLRLLLLASFIFFLPASQARADPILLETGIITGHPLGILLAGIALEAVIIACALKLPFRKTLAVTISANMVSGFVGLISYLLVRINGDHAFPLGPAFIFSLLIEIPIIYTFSPHIPFPKILKAVTLANFTSLVIGMVLLTPIVLPARCPTSEEDMEFSRDVANIRFAVEKYYDKYDSFPITLIGGRKCGSSGKNPDPLLDSGILESYPDNPYADSLRSLRFNPVFMISGIGKPDLPVNFKSPTTAWEFRWFPALNSDPRFGGPENSGNLLCANGLSDSACRETLADTFYNMNGSDIVPGCIFYKSYDFNWDGLPDDYILGGFGWPDGIGTVVADIIDRRNGNISLSVCPDGSIIPGQPDGVPEPLAALYIAGSQ